MARAHNDGAVTEADRQHWNAVLATRDPELIEPVKELLLTDIFTRIMNQDEQYQLAGWRPMA